MTETNPTDPSGVSTLAPGAAETPRLARTALLVGMDGSAPSFVAGLQAEGVQTLVIDRPDEALEAASRLGPELVVLKGDLEAGSSESSASRLVKALRGLNGVGRIIVLVPSADPVAALAAMALGADDVVPPPHSVDTVLLRARLAKERLTLHTIPAHAFRTIRIDSAGERVMDGDGSIPLTGRENELLARLIAAEGQPVSRGELLVDIWGGEQESVAVLDATVHRLRRKLEANPANPKIITTVRGIGYRLEMARVQML